MLILTSTHGSLKINDVSIICAYYECFRTSNYKYKDYPFPLENAQNSLFCFQERFVQNIDYLLNFLTQEMVDRVSINLVKRNLYPF